MGQPIEPGYRSGRWTVIREVPKRGKNRYFLCRCDCGTEKEISAGSVIYGQSGSCGCLKREVLTGRQPANTSHNESGNNVRDATPEYTTWVSMKQRCSNPRVRYYQRYGGRGITVCDRWLHSYDAFLADMGRRPDGACIERIDNDGPYSPDNCRWATPKEQANNRRSSVEITWRGETLTIAEWAERTGISAATLYWRFHDGWDAERTLTSHTVMTLSHEGRTLTISEWAAELGISRSALELRLQHGWPLERALSFGRYVRCFQ